MNDFLLVLFGGLGGIAALLTGYATVRRLKPQEKSDIATAVSVLSTAAATLVAPMENRITVLEKRIYDQEEVIGGLKAQVRILQDENTLLRSQVETLKGAL